MRDSRVHTERLLADGPYRYVRNPLYLGNIFMAIGIGLTASRTGFLILSLGMTVFVIQAQHPDIPVMRIYMGTLPFLVADFVLVAMLILWPGLALWLPRILY